MDDSVAYVHEDDSPNEVIETFFKTREQLFIVVNSSEEYLGIVLLDDVLLGLLGARIGSDFTQFDDLKAVAAKNHNASINQEDETDSLETITEIDETVVE
jgi:CBS domain containing-hemolysin-like protein